MLLLICALVPTVFAPLLPRVRAWRARMACVMAVTCVTSLFVGVLAIGGKGTEAAEIFRLSPDYRFVLRLDGAGKAYLCLAALLWPLAVLYAVEYMRHEKREGCFFGWYTAAYGAAILLGTADNLFTLYVSYELLTMCTVPLVWHEKDDASTRAALSYMLFLLGGAALGFAAMAGLNGLGLGAFHAGATIKPEGQWFLTLCFLGFLGFGVKAAVLPLSRWLPTASVAPTPVTALLHAVAVVNAGVYAVSRFLYDVIDPAWLRDTWVQTAMIALSAATVLYGAAMAVREQHAKRRLAWSTVSNLSYMLFGLSLLTAQGRTAGLSHMVFHGLMKIILFFCAGAATMQTGRTQVRQMHGLGRKMPVVFLSFALAGASLLGVPPLPGFVSKYALVTAAFDQGSALAMIGAVSLLIAAVLTAVYIFTVVYPAFFMKLNPAEGDALPRDPGPCIKISLIALCLLLALTGVFAGRVMAYLAAVSEGGIV